MLFLREDLGESRAAVVALIAMASTPALTAVSGVGPPQGYTKATRASNGMVSSARQLASEAGLEVPKRGGNAVDAAAVVQFLLNVAEPLSTGIGGGAFIMFYDAASGTVHAIDARQEAPALYREDIFLDSTGKPAPFDDRSTGGMPVGVPGTLAGWALALKRFGTISLAEALQPAIRIAEEGFVLTPTDAASIAATAKRLAKFPASARLFLHEDGTPLKAGEVFRNPDLAQTFRIIACDGIDAFYRVRSPGTWCGPCGRPRLTPVS